MKKKKSNKALISWGENARETQHTTWGCGLSRSGRCPLVALGVMVLLARFSPPVCRPAQCHMPCQPGCQSGSSHRRVYTEQAHLLYKLTPVCLMVKLKMIVAAKVGVEVFAWD